MIQLNYILNSLLFFFSCTLGRMDCRSFFPLFFEPFANRSSIYGQFKLIASSWKFLHSKNVILGFKPSPVLFGINLSAALSAWGNICERTEISNR